MAEIPKYNNSEKFEIINNEKNINNKIGNIEKNTEIIENNKKALYILNKIDSQIPGIDIDLAYDKENNAYHFISGENGLDFPIKLNSLEDIGKILIKLFSKDLYLGGDKQDRFIIDDSWIHIFDDYLVSNSNDAKNKSELSNKQIEELFLFTMQSQSIDIKDWDINNIIASQKKLGIDLGKEKTPFYFRENNIKEYNIIEENKIEEIIEYIGKNKDLFKNKNLYQIKKIINSNSEKRRELSLLFLAQSIKKGYDFKINDDRFDYIRNFTTDNMICNIQNNPKYNSKIIFTLQNDNLIVSNDKGKLGNIKLLNPFDLKILKKIINQSF